MSWVFSIVFGWLIVPQIVHWLGVPPPCCCRAFPEIRGQFWRWSESRSWRWGSGSKRLVTPMVFWPMVWYDRFKSSNLVGTALHFPVIWTHPHYDPATEIRTWSHREMSCRVTCVDLWIVLSSFLSDIFIIVIMPASLLGLLERASVHICLCVFVHVWYVCPLLVLQSRRLWLTIQTWIHFSHC